MALGQRLPEVFRLVVGEGLRLTAAGLVFGIAGSLAVGRLLTTMLFGVGRPIREYSRGRRRFWSRWPGSPVRSRRGGPRVDPMIALRAE